MEENKKVVQTLTDEELMDLVGGANFLDKFRPFLPIGPVVPPITALYAISPVRPVVPPIMALYAISATTKMI